MEDLSTRQREILDFLLATIDQTGVFPSYREIGAALGIGSTNGVSDHLKALERKGYLDRVGGRGASRSMRLSDKATRKVAHDGIVGVPLVGRVAAGPLHAAVEDYTSTLRVDASLLPRSGEVIALTIKGDSMIEEGIHDGDTLFVQRTPTVRNGEIAVVLVDGEATCKRLFRESGKLRLQPANSAMQPIYVDDSADEVQVVGRAVGVWRTI
ncbi:MAG: transcriptional repressor LexA [Myxococcota bacterium]